MKITNIFKHFNTITKHKWNVFKLTCKVGLPWRGLVHDLSKYSPTEFIESAKYYDGKRSPIYHVKKEHGYSKAWLHHKGRNKHHYQYWIDLEAPDKTPVIPYKYAAEMICDMVAAGMTYNGKDFKNDTEINYYMTKANREVINEKIDKFIIDILTQIKEKGVKKALTKKNIKNTYDRNVEK